jgi:hypothetical protein
MLTTSPTYSPTSPAYSPTSPEQCVIRDEVTHFSSPEMKKQQLMRLNLKWKDIIRWRHDDDDGKNAKKPIDWTSCESFVTLSTDEL